MDEHVKKSLEEGGIDVQDLLERCMGSEALLARLLKKFPADVSYDRLCTAVDVGDEKAALEASHTLKGVCGNLSCTRLFALLDKQVQAFRAGKGDEARALMPDIAQAYSSALRAIASALS